MNSTWVLQNGPDTVILSLWYYRESLVCCLGEPDIKLGYRSIDVSQQCLAHLHLTLNSVGCVDWASLSVFSYSSRHPPPKLTGWCWMQHEVWGVEDISIMIHSQKPLLNILLFILFSLLCALLCLIGIPIGNPVPKNDAIEQLTELQSQINYCWKNNCTQHVLWT